MPASPAARPTLAPAERALRAWIDEVERRQGLAGMYRPASGEGAARGPTAWGAQALNLAEVDLSARARSGRRLTALGSHPHLTPPQAADILRRLAPTRAPKDDDAVREFVSGWFLDLPVAGARVGSYDLNREPTTLSRWTAAHEADSTAVPAWWRDDEIVHALARVHTPTLAVLRHWRLLESRTTRDGLHGAALWAIYHRVAISCPQIRRRGPHLMERLARLGGLHPQWLRGALLSPDKEIRATAIRFLGEPVDPTYWAANPVADVQLPPPPTGRVPTAVIGENDPALRPVALPPWWHGGARSTSVPPRRRGPTR